MRKAAVLMLAPLLAASECTPAIDRGPPIDLKVAPSRLRTPAFAASSGGLPMEPVGEFAVSACRPERLLSPVWQIARKERSDAQAKQLITYGEVPAGYTEVKPAQPLVPGRCYVAVASGPGSGFREFKLLPDGRVSPGAGGRVATFRQGHQIERAAVHCLRAYRRARTPGETDAVDRAPQAVADTSVTCAELRAGWPTDFATAESSERKALQIVAGIGALIALFVVQDKLGLYEK
jgi:hypothetical protein